MLKNPKVNRIIGYIAMFLGFIVVYKGAYAGTAPDGVNGGNAVLLFAGIIIVIGAVLWMILKVRCPHCNGLLHLKWYNIDRCPHCGKSTDGHS